MGASPCEMLAGTAVGALVAVALGAPFVVSEDVLSGLGVHPVSSATRAALVSAQTFQSFRVNELLNTA